MTAVRPSQPASIEDAISVQEPPPVPEELVEESLVEEVSIDGMCGVY